MPRVSNRYQQGSCVLYFRPILLSCLGCSMSGQQCHKFTYRMSVVTGGFFCELAAACSRVSRGQGVTARRASKCPRTVEAKFHHFVGAAIPFVAVSHNSLLQKLLSRYSLATEKHRVATYRVPWRREQLRISPDPRHRQGLVGEVI